MKIKQDTSKTSVIPSASRRNPSAPNPSAPNPSTPGLPPFTVYIDAYDVQGSPELDVEVTEQDVVFNQTTSAVTYKEGRVQVINALNPSLENKTPSICNMAPDGQLTRITEGTAEIWVTDSGVTKPVKLDMRNSGEPTTTKVFNRLVIPSLMAHCADQIDSRLVGMVKAENINLYTSQNHSTRTFVRNSNCWLTLGQNPIDLTCISPSNSRGGPLRAGTLITPRHAINAGHYPLYNGDKIYFVTQDGTNTVIERTVVGAITHPDYFWAYPDLRVYTLDSDLPASIKPCRTLPADYGDYIVHTQYGLPATLGLDQEEKGIVADLSKITTNTDPPGVGFRVGRDTPTDPKRLEFYEEKISGDSGNPMFMAVENELILLTCWTQGGAGSGTSILHFREDINTLMIPAADAQAGISPTGYTLQTIDLSGFPTFL